MIPITDKHNEPLSLPDWARLCLPNLRCPADKRKPADDMTPCVLWERNQHCPKQRNNSPRMTRKTHESSRIVGKVFNDFESGLILTLEREASGSMRKQEHFHGWPLFWTAVGWPSSWRWNEKPPGRCENKSVFTDEHLSWTRVKAT
jgi:hypothetical protein